MKKSNSEWPKPDRCFEVEIYSGRVYLYRDKKRFEQACKFLDYPYDTDGVAGVCLYLVHQEQAIYLIGWFNDRLSTLMHEMFHLQKMLFEHANIKPELDTGGETAAYLLGALVRQMGLDKIKVPS